MATATAPRSFLALRQTLTTTPSSSLRRGGSGRVSIPPVAAVGVGARRRWVAVRASAAEAEDRMEETADADPEGIISGEWPGSSCLISYDDLRAYLKPRILKEKMVLREVMSTHIRAARPYQTLEEVDHYFEVVSGLPVVDDELKCIGVISKRDKGKASLGLKSKVTEVMSSPPITLPPDKTVMDAAALMLKMKIHRIPILNEEKHVIGMVTRTDIFQMLEAAKV